MFVYGFLMTFQFGLVVSPWFKIYKFEMCVHRILQRVRLANRGRLLLRTPGPVHLGLAFVLMLRPFFPEFVVSTDLLSFETPLGTSILL